MTYRMTRHGQVRAQQRGIKSETISFVVDNADMERYARAGCRELGISRKRLAALRVEGAPANLLDRAQGKRVIVAEEAGVLVVLTTYPVRH